MGDLIKDENTKRWSLTENKTVKAQSGDVISHLLHTAGTYVDRDIEIIINPEVRNGVQTVNTVNEQILAPKVKTEVAGTILDAAGISTSEPTSGEFKTITTTGIPTKGSVSVQPQTVIITSGWVSEGTTGNVHTTEVTPTTEAGATYYIPIVEPEVTIGGIDTSEAKTKITTNVSTATNSKYQISASSSGTITVTDVSLSNEAGYVEAHTGEEKLSSSVNLSSTANPVYIQEGSSEVTGGALNLTISEANDASQDVTIRVHDSSSVNAQVIESAPTDGSYYIAIDATTAPKDVAVVTAGREAIINTVSEGYVSSAEETAITAASTNTTVSIKGATSNKFVKVDKGSLGITPKVGESYTTVSTDTIAYIPSGGSLYIEEGYYKPTQISLAQIVPDDATIKAATSTAIVNGQKAYDSDGNLILGELTKIESFDFSGGGLTSTATVTSDNVGISTVNNGIAITASAIAKREAINYNTGIGYVTPETGKVALTSTTSSSEDSVFYISSLTIPEKTEFNIDNNGIVNISTSESSTVNVGDTTILENGNFKTGTFDCISSATSTALATTISTSTVGGAVTNAANGSAITEAPTSGVYVAIETGEASAQISSTATTTSAGWISEGQNVTSNPVTVTLSSEKAYIPIKETTYTASVDTQTVTQVGATSTASVLINGATLQTSVPEAQEYITISPRVSGRESGTVRFRGAATVSSAGWASEGTVYSGYEEISVASNATTDNANYYIPIYAGSMD